MVATAGNTHQHQEYDHHDKGLGKPDQDPGYRDPADTYGKQYTGTDTVGKPSGR